MKLRTRPFAFVALVAGGLAACSDAPTSSGPSLPGGSSGTSQSVDLESEVAGDSLLASVALEDAAVTLSVSAVSADPALVQADQTFRQARLDARGGNPHRARQRATEARRMIAARLIEARGVGVVDELFARVQDIRDRISESDDEFEGLAKLGDALDRVLASATDLQAKGNLVGAGERLIFGLQLVDRARLRHRDFQLSPQQVARLAVARGGAAVALSARLLGDTPTEVQLRIQTYAEKLLRAARAELAIGAFRRAALLGYRTEGAALLAVLGGERPTEEVAARFLTLADELIAQAEAAIGDSPTPIQRALLARAVRLRNAGADKLQNGKGGVGLLWHASVIAELLL